MLVSGIKSRPVYTGLTLDPHAEHHLIAVEGEGALAVLDMLSPAPRDAAEKATILYTKAGSAPVDHEGALAKLHPYRLQPLPTIQTLLIRLQGFLTTAKMGTRLYIAGTEGFIGQAMQVALNNAIDFHSVRAEHRGSLARRIQCVHCKGFTENVTMSHVPCAHCGLNLLVRDHYSRRLGAFQGVCIDAEVPGELPPAEEIFP